MRSALHRRARASGAITAALAATAVLTLTVGIGARVAPPEPLTISPVAAQPGADPGICTRDITYRGVLTRWTFDPCVPDGDPLPADVHQALEEDWQEENDCPSATPTPTATPARQTVAAEPAPAGLAPATYPSGPTG
ncbi:hypothetical protein ACIA5A_19675, partial [Micromonospora sp. NPDC051300]